MSVLFFIPARKNSKGIINKNLSMVNNKKLIVHTVDFLKKIQKKYKDENFYYLISSDSTEILNLFQKHGFLTEYKRPKNLSKDKSLIVDAVLHATEWLKNKKFIDIETVVLLQPTNPLRELSEFDKLFKFYLKSKIKSTVSVTKIKQHPYECIEKINQNNWKFIEKAKGLKKRGRQEYKNNFFFIDGTYYISSLDFINKHKDFVVEGLTKTYLIDRFYPIDIDEPNDLRFASFLIKNKNFFK